MLQKQIRIDPSRKLGKIRPLHAVNAGPVTHNFRVDAREEFRAAGIPYGRTHDIEYPHGCGEFVDIHCVFPWFRADVNDPESYNFALTDEYFKEMLSAGTKPFYRLGETIEHQPVKRHIFPPADAEKWGEICSHIIAHYNEGWANGFHMGIEYWEIWNEPDLKNRCWTGTEEEFFALYDAAATIIRRDHPHVKVGGCAFTGPHAGMAERWLAHLKVSGAPMDFFSWHGYIHTPEQAVERAQKAAELLDKYGFTDAESIYNEWNYVIRWDDTIQRSIDAHREPFYAAFCAAVIASLQSTRTDMAMYYDAQQLTWNGLFDEKPMHVHGERQGVIPRKPYYALYGWNKLYQAGTSVFCDADDGLYAAAATDGNDVWVYVSYYNDDAEFGARAPEAAEVTFDPGCALRGAEVFVTDSGRTNVRVPLEGGKLRMEGNSFALVRLPAEVTP